MQCLLLLLLCVNMIRQLRLPLAQSVEALLSRLLSVLQRRKKEEEKEKGTGEGERAEGFDANPREDSDAHDDDEEEEEEEEDNTSTTNTNTNMEKKKWSEKNGKQSWSGGCSTGKKGN